MNVMSQIKAGGVTVPAMDGNSADPPPPRSSNG